MYGKKFDEGPYPAFLIKITQGLVQVKRADKGDENTR
tara:strand:+ start:384 stop:494 length:111 start_codon:yes stop_codon:yes gene_type:complete